MLILVVFYIEGGIDKSVNWYVCFWDVGGAVVSTNVEVLNDLTGYADNGDYTIVGALD